MKLFKLFGIIAFVAIIGFSFAACGDGADGGDGGAGGNGGDAGYADYYGTWKYTESATVWKSITISSDKIQVSLWTGGSYTLENLTWAPLANKGYHAANYPMGVTITGKLTQTGGGSRPPKADGSGNYALLNEMAEDYWYIHNDKQSLCWGSWSDKEGADAPFVKIIN